jgi:aminoglycoside 6'-N-acetyltransferase I
MAGVQVRPAQPEDRNELAAMRASLWPESQVGKHLREIDEALSTEICGTLPMAIFVSLDDGGALTGFLEAGLRSHADGCDPARPTGYIEGWFVREEFRNRGVGRDLMRAAEEWALSQGCSEMASDALIDNTVSQRAHEALGFEVVDRCVHFRKRL